MQQNQWLICPTAASESVSICLVYTGGCFEKARAFGLKCSQKISQPHLLTNKWKKGKSTIPYAITDSNRQVRLFCTITKTLFSFLEARNSWIFVRPIIYGLRQWAHDIWHQLYATTSKPHAYKGKISLSRPANGGISPNVLCNGSENVVTNNLTSCFNLLYFPRSGRQQSSSHYVELPL